MSNESKKRVFAHGRCDVIKQKTLVCHVTEGGVFQVEVPKRAKKSIEKPRRPPNSGFAKTPLFGGVNLVTTDAASVGASFA